MISCQFPIIYANNIYKAGINDKKEKKCIKWMERYSEAFKALEKTFQNFSPENTAHALEQLSQVKQLRDKFNKLGRISLLPASFKQSLTRNDLVFYMMEVFASEALIGEMEEGNQSVTELENSIDLAAVKQDGKLLALYENTLKKIFHLYKKKGNSQEMEKVALTYRLFHEFNQKFHSNSWQFHYIFNLLVGSKAKYPLTYNDPRLDSVFRFFLQIPDIGGIPGKSQNFISECMQLPPDSPFCKALLQMGVEIVSSDKFQRGEEGDDENDIDVYRTYKLEFLIELAEMCKGCALPAIEKVPGQLKVNSYMSQHPRIKLLRYAHNLGLDLSEKWEWKIDRWMVDFRKQCLHDNIFDPYGSINKSSYEVEDLIEAESYFSRRDAKNLGLLTQTESNTPFDYSRVKEGHLRLTPESVSLILHKAQMNIETVSKITEEKMIAHLLNSDFSKQLQGYIEDDRYFSKEGARALLYALGYLKK